MTFINLFIIKCEYFHKQHVLAYFKEEKTRIHDVATRGKHGENERLGRTQTDGRISNFESTDIWNVKAQVETDGLHIGKFWVRTADGRTSIGVQ